MWTTRVLAIGLVVALLGACAGSEEAPDDASVATTTAEAPDAEETSEDPAPTSGTAAGGEADATPEEAVEPTAGATAAPSPREVVDIEAVAAGEQPDGGWVLDEGTYTSAAFDGFAVDIPAGTSLRHLAQDGAVALTQPGFASPDDVVWIVPADGIVPPERAGVHIPHDEDPLAFTLPVPDDLGAWFDAVPQAEVLAEGGGESPLGGYGWWDVVLRPELGDTFSDCGHQACIHNVVTEHGAAIHADVWTIRYAQSAVVPHVLVWSQERAGTGPAADFVEALVASSSPAP